MICDESNSIYNIFALRGNLGGNTTGNGNVPKLHGILSLSDSNNNDNNVPNGSIVCRGLNTASQYDLPLNNNISLRFCHIDNTRNGRQRNEKQFFFKDQFDQEKPVNFQVYDRDGISLSNIKFQILIVYQARHFPVSNLTINNNGIVSFPNANLNITNSNLSQKFDTIHVNNAYIAQAIVDQLQVLSDSELKIIVDYYKKNFIW